MATQEAREDIITLIVGMFNAAPGANILNQLVAAHDAGMTIPDMADVLATKPQFIQVYPTNLTSAEFAASLVDNLLPDSTPAAAQTWATNWVVTQLNGGATRAEVIVEALAALRATTNPNYADAQAQLENRVEVATYYSVTQQQSSTDLGELQAVVGEVTSDDDTVDEAKEEIDDAAGANGETFILTAGQDSYTGTSANDNIRALSIAEVFTSFDEIDGGAGRDTFDIYTTASENEAFPAFGVVENVEIVNVHNAAAAAALGDASKFAGVEQLWQIGAATGVTNLQATTTAGFRSLDAGVLTVAAAAGVASASVAFDEVGDDSTLAVTAGNTLNLTGSVADVAGVKGADPIATTFNASATATTATVNSDIDITLTQTGAKLTTLDASGSAGDITVASAIAAIKTGTGDDNVTTTTVTDKDAPIVSATVDTGDGADYVKINTSGDGTTTVNTGAGDDEVELASDGSGKLTVNLGAGTDTFNVSGGGTVSAGDSIDGGADSDTLLLSIVGAANIGAFSNFEVFDAAGLAKSLDVEILASKNTVTEIIATDDVGVGASLLNVGAGVNYRVTGDTDIANALTFTQKTAGPLTVTLDIDETGAGGDSLTADADAAVVTNATSVNAVFDSSFVKAASAVPEDNTTQLMVTASAATTLSVTSGGDNAINTLTYVDAADKLTSVTVTGASDLDLDIGGSSKLATVNASAMTGGLTFDAADLKDAASATSFDGGLLTLGSGDDSVTLVDATRIDDFGVGTKEDATKQDGFDVLTVVATQAADNNADPDLTIKDGLVTFLGAGPATLADAITAVDTLTAGSAAVFEYLGNSYVVAGGDVVQLVGVTGLDGLDDIGGAALYVF